VTTAATTALGNPSPLVVIGMHRSGTSLVARLLAAAGVHIGADLNTHAESGFFRELNRGVLRAAHAEWDWPLAMLPVLEDAELCAVLGERLAQHCVSREVRSFLGCRFGRARLRDRGNAWGWKDPRTTLTLPVWLRVFPGLRVVHVQRDGIDVTASLVARERQRRLHLDSAPRSSRCLDPERAFALWTEYLELGLRATRELPGGRLHTLRFEQLLERPDEALAGLLRFAGLEPDPARLRELACQVDRARGERFRGDDSDWSAFRRAKAAHPLMQQLQYGARS
jgi:hypothetical protein